MQPPAKLALFWNKRSTGAQAMRVQRRMRGGWNMVDEREPLSLVAGGRPGLLVISDRQDADIYNALVDAADLRLQAIVALDDAADWAGRAPSLDIILLQCSESGPSLPELLQSVDDLARHRGLSLIVQCTHATLDLAYAICRAPDTHFLCDCDWGDVAGQLVVARRARQYDALVRETDPEKSQLHRLSEDVARLTRTIESLLHFRTSAVTAARAPHLSDRSNDYIGMPAVPPADHGHGSLPPDGLRPAQVREIIRARRMRADFLPNDLFADPAWDMLLDLLAARLEGDRVSVSSLCIASAVPPTTALRWIRTLSEQGLVERHADPLDGRRIFIQLADHTAEALGRWFQASRRLLVAAAG